MEKKRYLIFLASYEAIQMACTISNIKSSFSAGGLIPIDLKKALYIEKAWRING